MYQEAEACIALPSPGTGEWGDTRKRTITSEHDFDFGVCCRAGKYHHPRVEPASVPGCVLRV